METVTDAGRLVVRSWTGGGEGEYSMEKMQKQLMGIYEADWDVEKEIVIGEPFISYLVHDAVAEAGLADKLPELYRRWSQFLTGGYDTIGECWGWGTHVHGWSSTPTKDMVFYTLGVTPAEPGYTTARIAPRMGGLDWAKGKVPTAFGLISVEVRGRKRKQGFRVRVHWPVPFMLRLVIGYVLAVVISRIGNPMPPAPGTDFSYRGEILVTWRLAASSFLIAALSTMVASLFPASKASRLNVVDPLRYAR